MGTDMLVAAFASFVSAPILIAVVPLALVAFVSEAAADILNIPAFADASIRVFAPFAFF